MGVYLADQRWGQLMSLPIRHGSAVLVDTNAYQRKMLRTLLRSSGFNRVLELDNFEDGVDEANRSFPDFLFVDYDTARRSELLRGNQNIRTKHLAASCHVIFLMQNPTRARVDAAISSGANWVLSRPFSPKSLDRRIRAVLDPGSCMRIEFMTDMVSADAPKKEEKAETLSLADLTAEMNSLLKQSQHYRNGKNKPDAAAKAAMLKKLQLIEAIKSGQSDLDSDPMDAESSVILL